MRYWYNAFNQDLIDEIVAIKKFIEDCFYNGVESSEDLFYDANASFEDYMKKEQYEPVSKYIAEGIKNLKKEIKKEE